MLNLPETSKIIVMEKQLFTFLWGFCLVLVYGQQEPQNVVIPDSLFQKTYEELETNFNEFKSDSAMALLHAKAYLKKSIADNDTIKRADGYYFLSLIYEPSISEKYADSIILFTKHMDTYIYPARGFLAKSRALQRMGKYKGALETLSKVYTSAITDATEDQRLEVNKHIGLFKTDLGDDKGALNIFRSYLYKIEQKYERDKSYADKYIIGLFALGDAYNRNAKYDSATIINKKGFEISSTNKGSLISEYFTLSMGVTAYLKKHYDNSLDSLQKVVKPLKTINDTGNLMVCYLYMGKAYWDQDKMDKAIPYFKKIDTIVRETSYVFPEIREAYKSLVDYYQERGDTKNQSVYSEISKSVDSLIKENIDNYYTSMIDLLEILGQKIEEKNTIRRNNIISLSVITFFISVFTYYYYRRQKMYRIKFEALLNKKDTEEKQAPNSNETRATKAALNIPETVIENILARLELFVREKYFLNNDISLHHLAQLMDTNPNYLSKIINFYEQKSFNAYIKELRINYAIKELKINTTYRRYSVKAMAEEVGFNNTQSFSRAFYKKTGIYPSYFIRELEKEKLRKLRSSKKAEDKDQNGDKD